MTHTEERLYDNRFFERAVDSCDCRRDNTSRLVYHYYDVTSSRISRGNRRFRSFFRLFVAPFLKSETSTTEMNREWMSYWDLYTFYTSSGLNKRWYSNAFIWLYSIVKYLYMIIIDIIQKTRISVYVRSESKEGDMNLSIKYPFQASSIT